MWNCVDGQHELLLQLIESGIREKSWELAFVVWWKDRNQAVRLVTSRRPIRVNLF